ncbi:MAG: NADH-quinone oxidoreductase subunit N [Planctomycetes bacterium]|nr:NADH-quinone oxidoreductase subunit N [Planctomycetota bacterium]
MSPLSSLSYDVGDFLYVIPIAIPALFGMIVLILDIYLGRGSNKTPLALTSGLGCLLTAVAAWALWAPATGAPVMAGTLAPSAFGAVAALAILIGTTLIGFSVAHHSQSADGVGVDLGRSIAHGELYGLLLFATSGMLAMTIANDMVTFFVAIETLSIAVYALTGVERRRARSAEGAMKYFVLGAFSAAFLLYGMSLLYGATGTMRLDVLAETAIKPSDLPMATVGGTLILIGLLFKVGAVPFHAWVPDAYEGAPSAVTGFMSIGVKVAAFAGMFRIVEGLGACGALGADLAGSPVGSWVLWFVAALTVIGGNAGALTQRNPRRLMAYSGIAHTGYLLVALVAFTRQFGHSSDALNMTYAAHDAAAGLLFYLLAYALANAGVFAVINHLERRGEDVDSLDDLAGLAHTQPRSALVMAVCLLSLAGIPGTAGFLGKLWVFRAGVASGDVGLVVLALMASAISLYYYLRIVVIMYMREPQAGTAGASSEDPQRWCSRLAILVAGVLTIWLGVYPPNAILKLVVDGAQALVH